MGTEMNMFAYCFPLVLCLAYGHFALVIGAAQYGLATTTVYETITERKPVIVARNGAPIEIHLTTTVVNLDFVGLHFKVSCRVNVQGGVWHEDSCAAVAMCPSQFHQQRNLSI